MKAPRVDYRKCLYIKVTADKYELPLYVAASVAELAEKTGDKKSVISQNVRLGFNNYRRVILDEFAE